MPATRILLAQAGGRPELIAPTGPPSSADDLEVLARFAREVGRQTGIPPQELALFTERLLTLLVSCDARRLEQWEALSWWDYIGADRRTAAFQKFLADGLTRTLVAAQARQISARTGGLILAQLVQDLTRAGGRPADRVLDAPTSEAWIDPWLAHLRALGVTLHGEHPVAGIACDGRRITGVTVQTPAGPGAGHRRPLRRRPAGRAAPAARVARAARRRAAPGRAAAARRALDERRDVLPRPRRPAPARARPVHRLRVGADGDLAGAVLAGRRPRAARRRPRRGDPLRRHLRVGAPRAADRQGGDGLHAGRDPDRGLGPADGPHRRRLARRGERPVLVPGPRDRVPEPHRGDEPRAAPDQHEGLVGGPAGRRDADPEPVPRRRLRPHPHRPRDDGGRERGGAARGQRDPRRDRLARGALPGLEAARAAAARPVPPARRAALEAGPAAGAPAGAGERGRRRRAGRRRVARAARRSRAA